ncbi:NFACT RNA binding domain-containing protein [Hymenobacter sp. BRD67]|uniref:NFACT RNA binding domain-containing protein n=1 Tax=Hymenobacter sp. BRD67 TaxID=2675877 RepID=UPI0015640CCA|nr:NFACT RNA binding domain-containing protein [Hymenobacter sp. BRD67]QKG51990.1 fibronectin/fibrinogen-binding protein [Hymenobacter sp. BRD67]
MHTNYYFLRQLAPALTERLRGCRVASCFSQEKDELVLGLLSEAGTEYWLKAQLGAGFPALALPEAFHRARQNSVDLLPELLGRTVASVEAWPQDRVLQVNFEEEAATLVFKLYGPRPNAIFRAGPTATPQLFHQRYATDAELRPAAPSSSAGLLAGNAMGKLPPALADLPARFLRELRGYEAAPPERKLRLAAELLAELENPAAYYFIYLDGRTRLSLVPLGEILETLPGPDPVAALRRFIPLALARRALEAERRQLRQLLTRRAEEAGTSAHLASLRLRALAHEAGYRHRADLIMANLHAIAPGAAQLEAIDFYTNEAVVVKLKPLEKPQRTAENLYRKAKNQQIEERQLQARISSREAEAMQALELLEELDARPALHELRNLRAWRKLHALDPAPAAGKAGAELPFKVFEYMQFTILVGRNAQNNDLLTQKYAHKDDLWLHAKDVSGSHVVIRHRSGQAIPEPVIARAAQLAGWYSRRQHDSLCPVTVTPKKFVRKPKGALPGQVLVERERVILVVPGNPFENN